MDFVPSKAKKKAETEVIVPKPKVATRVSVPKKVVAKKVEPRKVEPKKAESKRTGPRLGVIEDLGTSYKDSGAVSTVATQRGVGREDLKAVKAKKVGLKGTPEESSGLTVKPKDNKVYKTPKSPFINQDKVVKRPLSKNVYQKKVEVPKEEPKGPVTIITKPEKQAHVSLIVTIILTIILGAAAGTVAFLLLPK